MGAKQGRMKGNNRKLSTVIWKEGTRDCAKEKEETKEAKVELGIGETAVRWNREEKER